MYNYNPVYDRGKVSREHEKLEAKLVNTEADFREMVEDWVSSGRKVAAFDTETAPKDRYADSKRYGAAALSPEHSFLVGCSLAFGFERGYYLPFGHRSGDNLPEELFLQVEEILLRTQQVIYWNAKHDFRIQEANGHSRYREIKAFDASVLVWNCDTNAGNPGLKDSERRILGWERPDFSQVVGAHDASWTKPEELARYAVLDVLGPLHIVREMRDWWKGLKTPVSLDNKVIEPVKHMEDSAHPIDIKYVREMREQVDPEMERLRHEMRVVSENPAYDPAKTANNDATREALLSLGLDTGERTKRGKMRLKEDFLVALAERDDTGFAQMILDYRSLGSLKSKALNALIGDYREDLGGVRFQYNINKVRTGRFSSGNGAKNPYFTRIGAQNVQKGSETLYYATPGGYLLGHDFEECEWVGEDQTVLVSKDDGRVMATRESKFHDAEPSDGQDEGWIVEGYSPKLNVRRAFTARDGQLFVHVDYAAEELRIPANMSGDPRMTEIFVNGLDMHEMTAKELFGEENYDRSKRSMAKPFNFGLLYGGTRKMFAPVLGCTEDEAQVYIDKWWNMFSKLKVWADRNVSMAKNRGYVETAFGRRRYTKPEAENPKLRWRVKNIALNSPVQGTGGDLMRLALAKFHRRLVPAYGEDVVRVLSMVHDEVNFSIDPERLVPVCRDIRELMDIRLPGWEVPMVADFEIGYSWGEIYKFELTDEGFVPQGDRVERRSA